MRGARLFRASRSINLLGTGDSMSKEETQVKLQDAFTEFAAEYPKSALAMITGLFVGLLEYSVENAGGDPKQEIKIDGCGKRDITVSAVPNA